MEIPFEQAGCKIVPNFLTEAETEKICLGLTEHGVTAGTRNLSQCVPEIAAFAASFKVLSLLRLFLGRDFFPVRSIFFDKTPETNWLVPWHQDLSIAVKSRVNVPGFGPWSMKKGVQHVQPPVRILEQMITLRLQLDPGDELNGPLRVIPGSHRLGRLTAADIRKTRLRHSEITCLMQAGDALLMPPLLLHASSPAVIPHHRRVIHIEYAAYPLTDGLEWAET